MFQSVVRNQLSTKVLRLYNLTIRIDSSLNTWWWW